MKQRDDWHLTELLHNAPGRGDPFAAAVRATRMPMVITDPGQADNPIVFANEAFQQLSGYSREEIVGRNCRFLQGPDTDRTSIGAVRAAIESGESIDIDILNYRKDGTSFWNALYMSPVRSDQGDIQFFSRRSSTSRSVFRPKIACPNKKRSSSDRSRRGPPISRRRSKPRRCCFTRSTIASKTT